MSISVGGTSTTRTLEGTETPTLSAKLRWLTRGTLFTREHGLLDLGALLRGQRHIAVSSAMLLAVRSAFLRLVLTLGRLRSILPGLALFASALLGRTLLSLSLLALVGLSGLTLRGLSLRLVALVLLALLALYLAGCLVTPGFAALLRLTLLLLTLRAIAAAAVFLLALRTLSPIFRLTGGLIALRFAALFGLAPLDWLS